MQPKNTADEVGIIDYAGRLVTNDNVRHAIAVGDVFRMGYNATLAAGASTWLVFDPSLNGTNTNPHIHKLLATVRTTASDITMELWEGATLSDNGTEITMFGFNCCDECDPSLNPYAKMYHTPTIDSSGNKYAPDVYVHAVTGGPGGSITSSGSASDEYSAWLNPKYKYLYKFTNVGANSTRLDVNARIIREPKYRAGGR